MATEGLVTMSKKEVLRLQIVEKLYAGEIIQKEAGKILNISTRQVRRLLKQYILYGVSALVSKKRNKASNNRISEEYKQNILKIARGKYIDFGPTFIVYRV